MMLILRRAMLSETSVKQQPKEENKALLEKNTILIQRGVRYAVASASDVCASQKHAFNPTPNKSAMYLCLWLVAAGSLGRGRALKAEGSEDARP